MLWTESFASEAVKSSNGLSDFGSTSRKSRTNFFTSGGVSRPAKEKPLRSRALSSSIRYW